MVMLGIELCEPPFSKPPIEHREAAHDETLRSERFFDGELRVALYRFVESLSSGRTGRSQVGSHGSSLNGIGHRDRRVFP